MDINNYLLMKQGLIKPSEMVNNNVPLYNDVIGNQRSNPINITNNNNCRCSLDEYAELTETCPSVNKVRDYFRDRVEEINEIDDF